MSGSPLLEPDVLERARRRLGVAALGTAISSAEGTRHLVVGTTSTAGGDLVTEQDAWHLGSCTKSLTAAVYARLVETGRATWTATVAELVPDVMPHPAWAERSVAELFWCRAGVAANLPSEQVDGWHADRRTLPEQRTTATAAALAVPPLNPGRFVYSNLGYVVAGAAIDRIAGSWEGALRSELLEPAGVTCGFGPPARILGHRPKWRIGGLLLGRGRPAEPDSADADNPPVLSSAGTLVMSLPDWARMHRMFHADAPGPLSGPSISRMMAVPEGGQMGMGWGRDRDGRPGVQGSNTLWSATALMSRDRSRTALVVANDGRTRVLTASVSLARQLLAD